MSEMFATAEAAAEWRKGAATREAAFAEPTARMLDAAQLLPGATVVDVGTGSGDVAFAAAVRVGPTGRVIATDIAPAMVAVTEEEIAARGLTNVEAMVMDAAHPSDDIRDADAVIGRNSLQFVDGTATVLQGLSDLLRPGGRIAFLVWGPAADNAYFTVATDAARDLDLLRAPDGQVMRPFHLSDAEALCDDARAAGFADCTVTPVRFIRVVGDVDEAMRTTCGGPLAATIKNGLDDDERARWTAEVRRRIEGFASAGTIAVPATFLLLSGSRT